MRLTIPIFNMLFYISINVSHFKAGTFAFGADFASYKNTEGNLSTSINLWLGLISFHCGVIK